MLSAFVALIMLLCSMPALVLSEGKITEEEIVLTVMQSEHANQPILQDSPVLRGIQEMTGIKIDMQPIASSDYANKKNVLLASNNMPDIMRITQTDVNNYARTGMFEALTPYMDAGELENYKVYFDSDENFLSLLVDGTMYGFVECAKLGTALQNGFGPCIRIDLLEKHGLEVPTTWDELYDVLYALKQEYPDSRPYTSRNGTLSTVRTGAYSYGTGETIYFDEEVDGGRYVYGPATEEFKEWLTFLNKMYVNGVLDPDYASNSSQTWQENMTSGKSFFYYDNSGFSTSMTATLQVDDPAADVRLINIMENPEGLRRNRFYSYHWYDESYVISADLADDARVAAVQLMDWLYSDDGILLTNWGIEGETYTMTADGPVYEPDLVAQFENEAYPYYSLWSYLGATLLAFSPTNDGNANRQVNPANNYLYDLCAEDEAYRQPILNPPFTEEETERITELTANLDNLRDLELDKFIMGERSLDTFDAFAQSLIDAGAPELEDIYNAARARMLGE